jgi:hypothetical protein
MSELWGLLDTSGFLVGRVSSSWEAPPGSELVLIPPSEADAAPQRAPYVPPEPVPVGSVPAWAAKAALEDAGLLDEAEVMAGQLGTTWKWRFAQAAEWLRGDVLPLGLALGLSELQVDDLMRDAANRAN